MTSLQGKRAVVAGLAAFVVGLSGTSAVSYMLYFRPAQTPKAISEEPANAAGSSVPVRTPSCWSIHAQGDSLSATWVPECTNLHPATLGNQPWPQGDLQIPADSEAPAPLARAITQTELSEDLAQNGAGGMLFLPTRSDGSGIYVAAWDGAEDENPANGALSNRGLQLGQYGVAPSSVATPAGRVFLRKEFAAEGVRETKRRLAEFNRTQADDDEEPAPLSSAPAAEGAPANARVSARDNSTF